MTRTIAVLHLAGNAVLLGMGYYWLGVGESRAATLAWSVFLLLLILSLACWLHSATFAYFGGAGLRTAFRTALQHLSLTLALVIAAIVLYLVLGNWSSGQKAVKIALWLLRWVLLPALLVPIFANVSLRGWRGLRPRFGPMRDRLEGALLVLCAFWVPLKLLGWVPFAGSFGVEMTSFVVRAAVSYLLFVFGCLLLERVTSRGMRVYVKS